MAWEEPLQIVEMPTAGIDPKNSYIINAEFFHSGGIRFDFHSTLFKDLLIGISYSGIDIVGSSKLSDIDFQGLPGIFLKYRLLDETISIPAIAIGLSTQGFGAFSSSSKRFETFSPGFFIICSKSFKNQLGFFSAHFGTNYSFEPLPKNRALNFFLGVQQEYKNAIALNIEYNATLDEIAGEYLKSKGLLNLSLQIYINDNFTIALIGKDLLLHFKNRTSIERKIFLQYKSSF